MFEGAFGLFAVSCLVTSSSNTLVMSSSVGVVISSTSFSCSLGSPPPRSENLGPSFFCSFSTFTARATAATSS